MGINGSILQRKNISNLATDRLCRSWLSRAAVRDARYEEGEDSTFDPELHDFPPGLLPFKGHPKYRECDEALQRRVETLAWVAWNNRVVETEEKIVCSALMTLLGGGTDIALRGSTRTAIRQTLIDEGFHSHMHEHASALAVQKRNVPLEIAERVCRPAYGYRSYLALAEGMSEKWERDIALLTWAVVGELSIYEFLTIVSSDPEIQTRSRTLLQLHERDEAAHASVIDHVLRAHYHEFGERQSECFLRCLPIAMNSLSQQDWRVWEDVLVLAGIPDSKEIIEDTEQDRNVPDELPLLRSYGRIEELCAELNIRLSSEAESIYHAD